MRCFAACAEITNISVAFLAWSGLGVFSALSNGINRVFANAPMSGTFSVLDTLHANWNGPSLFMYVDGVRRGAYEAFCRADTRIPLMYMPDGVRALLDARSEAQAVHGLEMRTELRFGAAADELQRQMSETPDQMLILGISDPAQLGHTFSALFASVVPYPMMIVYRPNREGEGAGE